MAMTVLPETTAILTEDASNLTLSAKLVKPTILEIRSLRFGVSAARRAAMWKPPSFIILDLSG